MQKRHRGKFFEALKKQGVAEKAICTTFRKICDALAINTPNPKISKEQTDFEFGMDILGELRKCPYELFAVDKRNVIKPTEQNKFRTQNEQGDEVLLKRYPKNQKFEMLTLGFLERLDIFKNIGIFSYIGNYYSNYYEKKLIDGATEPRYIVKKAYAMAHLKDDKGLEKAMDDKKEGILQKIKADEPTPFEPYLTKVFPKHIINENKIGFSKIDLKETKCQKYLLPQIEKNKKNKEKIKNPVPDVWLPRQELPALAFYAYLLDKKKSKNHTPNHLLEILFNHSFKPKEKKYLQKPTELILKKIEAYIKESEQRLDRLKKQRQIKVNYGKKQYRPPIKDGQMASWLASDIMKMQPSKANGKDKITSANHRALQRSLAISDVANWKSIFESAKLIGNQSGIKHPFLEKLQDEKYKHYEYQKNINNFYENYLSKRKEYFETWKNNVGKKAIKGANEIRFTDKTFIKLFGKYNKPAKSPTNKKFLPRGIFTEAIKNWFEENGCEEMKGVINGKKTNVAYMIQKYFELVENDSLPEVYTADRHYKFFDSLGEAYKGKYFENIEKVLKDKKPLRPIEYELKNFETNKKKIIEWRNYRKAMKNEDKIRLRGVQDRLLFMMSKKFIPEDMVQNEKYKLKNIEDIFTLKTKFSFKQDFKQEIKQDFKQEIKKQNEENNKRYYNGEVTFNFAETELKNYGKIYQYKTDSRIKSLSALIYKETENTFDEEKLNEEFEKYEEHRLEVFKKAFAMEEQFFKDNPEEKNKLDKLKKCGDQENCKECKECKENKTCCSYEKGYINFETLLKKMGISEQTLYSMAGIRNKFAHNDYVEKQYTEKKEGFELPEVAKHFKEEFLKK